MKKLFRPNLYLALIHYPVVNKNDQVIASAVTNLDLHDISRTAKTFSIPAFYIVTPLEDQVRLTRQIVAHWTKGFGGEYNPKRREALELIRIKATLADVKKDILENAGSVPDTVITTAKPNTTAISFDKMRQRLKNEKPCLLLFGTAWGLSEKIMGAADYILEPIRGRSGYNHLSVRAASAIILDRLLGKR